MSWILPKGIVKNSAEIEGSIERINTEPLDLADIAKFWKVYTTTKRRLLDPTAERLENYWWRIWGSRKRELNGATVASLFATISNGESFVPLRGPANRDEGRTPWIRTRPGGSGASSTTALNHQGQNQSRPSTTSSSVSKGAGAPHPILKKSSGPSSVTGPRPTARFISPHESDDDHSNDAGENSHVVVQPPSPDPPSPKAERKPSSGNGHGSRKPRSFVSGPSGKRPVVFRRKSSQSSSESLARSLETGSSGVESSLETPSPVYLQSGDAPAKQPSESKFVENFSPSNRLPSPSRNQQRASHTDAKRLSPRQPGTSSRRGAGNSPIEDSGCQPSEGNLTGKESEPTVAQRTLHPETDANDSQPVQASPKRSQSDLFQGSHKSSDSKESSDAGPIRYLSNDAKSSPSLARTLADARGQLATSQDTDSRSPKPPSRKTDKGKRRASDEPTPARPSMTRPTPPTNGNSDRSTFARSKSQLELVLEKDRARNGDRKGDGRN